MSGSRKQAAAFSAVSASGSWISSTRVSATFIIKNGSDHPCTVTVTLAATGGISNSSSVVTTMVGMLNNSITLEFDATTLNLTATLLFSDGVNKFPLIQFGLAPLLVISVVKAAIMCPATSFHARFVVTVKNIGNLSTRNLVMTIPLTGGVTQVKQDCASANPNPIVFGVISPGGSSSVRQFLIAASTSASKRVTMNFADSATNFPSSQDTVPIAPVADFSISPTTGGWTLADASTGCPRVAWQWHYSPTESCPGNGFCAGTGPTTTWTFPAYVSLQIVDQNGWVACVVRSVGF